MPKKNGELTFFEKMFTSEKQDGDIVDTLKVLNPDGHKEEAAFTAKNPGVAPELAQQPLVIESGADKVLADVLDDFDEIEGNAHPITYRTLANIVSTLPPYSAPEAILATLAAANIDVEVIKNDAVSRKEAMTNMHSNLTEKVTANNTEAATQIESFKEEIAKLEGKIRHGNTLVSDFGVLMNRTVQEIDGVMRTIGGAQ